MAKSAHDPLSRRERQIMDVIYRQGRMTAAEVLGALPTVSRDKARRSALTRIVQTFFEGSTAQAVAALLGEPGAKLSDEDLDRLSSLIDQARKDGR
jgi:predicted transcriptional regulator